MLSQMTNEEKVEYYKNNHDPNIIKIYKTKQTGLYVKNNVMPIDMYYDEDKLYHVFKKDETNAIYTKWLNRDWS